MIQAPRDSEERAKGNRRQIDERAEDDLVDRERDRVPLHRKIRWPVAHNATPASSKSSTISMSDHSLLADAPSRVTLPGLALT